MNEMDTKTRILRVSERLFALQGIDSVSLRSISTEVGQRNKTAAQYHFGSKEGLIKAIFHNRMAVINAHRQQMLDECIAQNRVDLRSMLGVLFEPFLRLLLDESGGRYYLRFAAQLFAQGRGVSLLSDPQLESGTQRQLFRMIKRQLQDLPSGVVNQRLKFMAGLLVQTTAAKDFEMEGMGSTQRARQVKKFSHELLDFVEGGLTAPVLVPCKVPARLECKEDK